MRNKRQLSEKVLNWKNSVKLHNNVINKLGHVEAGEESLRLHRIIEKVWNRRKRLFSKMEAEKERLNLFKN
jgi:hypothetical protein